MDLQQRADRSCWPIRPSPVGSSVGALDLQRLGQHGRMFISLKPLAERGNVSTQRVIDRLRPKLLDVGGMRVFMFPAQDIRVGGRQANSSIPVHAVGRRPR